MQNVWVSLRLGVTNNSRVVVLSDASGLLKCDPEAIVCEEDRGWLTGLRC